MPFFKTGPLAWNGAITFWGLFGTYFIWTGSMGVYMAKDAGRGCARKLSCLHQDS